MSQTYLPGNINKMIVIFLSFFIILTNLFLLAFTLLEKRSSLRTTYSSLLSTLTLWILGFGTSSLFLDETNVLIWLRCSYTGLIFFPVIFFHFVLSLTMNHSKFPTILKQAGYSLSLIFGILNLLGGLIQGVIFKDGFYYPDIGVFYYYYGIYFILFILYGNWLLYQRYNKTKSVIEKERLKYLLIGSCCGILSSLSNMGIDFFKMLYLVEYLTIVIFNLFINYVCIKYKLIELNIFIRREHLHYLTSTILVGLIAFIILVGQRLFPSNFFLLSMILAIGFGLSFHLVSRTISQFIERRFFKETFDKKEFLKRFSQNITSTFDKNLLLPSILDVLVNIMEIKTALIILYSPDEEECKVDFDMGLSETKRRKAIFSKTKGMIKWFSENKKTLLKENLRLDPRFENVFQDIENDLEKVESILAIPLVGKEGLRGIVCLGEKENLQGYNDEDIAFLNTFCDETTVALENTFLYEEKMKYFLNTILTLLFTIEAKDKYTKGHCENVGRYAAIVAQALGLSPTEVENIKIGGYLHDIGKIGIDDKILLKPGQLTGDEFEQIKKHPEIGVKILEAINLPGDIIDAVKYHHERISGNGYPNSLTKDGEPSLPLAASIIGIVDSYEAMTSDRPYRKAFSKEDAILELERGSEKLYDPKIVEVFIKLVKEGKI